MLGVNGALAFNVSNVTCLCSISTELFRHSSTYKWLQSYLHTATRSGS